MAQITEVTEENTDVPKGHLVKLWLTQTLTPIQSYYARVQVTAIADFKQALHLIKEVRCYEAKIEESEKARQPPGVEPRTPLA